MVDNPNDEVLVSPSEPLPIVEGTPQRQRSGAHWLHAVLYLITSLIFAFFLVLGGRWLYHKTHHSQTTVTPAANNAPAEPQVASRNAEKNKQLAQKSKSKTQKSANSSTRKNSLAKIPAEPMANTGPGNIAAIFVLVSVTATGAHYAVTARKPVN